MKADTGRLKSKGNEGRKVESLAKSVQRGKYKQRKK